MIAKKIPWYETINGGQLSIKKCKFFKLSHLRVLKEKTVGITTNPK
jgi:hypothetical protein